MDSPGKKSGVGCHFLLQGIFLTQGSNPLLLHWQACSLPRSKVELGNLHFGSSSCDSGGQTSFEPFIQTSFLILQIGDL